MNIFFYAIQETPQASEVLIWLKSLRPPLYIQILPCGLGLKSHESLSLRNGDLLIIFISNQKELRSLTDVWVEYNNYRIYLIFGKHDPELIKAGLLLNPRYYTTIEKEFIHTEETIRKILRQNQETQA